MTLNEDKKDKKDQKAEKQTQAKDSLENKKKGFIPPLNNPKPFQQFSNQNKFKGSSQKSFNAFHRRLGK